MTGVVLCGGQSSRMGKDKGLLQHHADTWAQFAASKLLALHLPVALSVNEAQYETYGKLFQNLMLVKDAALNAGGPLKGILSVHAQQPGEDLVLLACDMRNMQHDVLQHLLKRASTSKADAIVFRNEETIEPLCGIYSATGLKKIYAQYQHGLLKKFSMHAVLDLLPTQYLPLLPEWKKCFANYNTPQDLENL